MTEIVRFDEVPIPTRDEVIEELKQLTRFGVGDPADLPRDNPKVSAALVVLDKWAEA